MSLQKAWPLTFLDRSQFVKSNILFHLVINVFFSTFFPLVSIGHYQRSPLKKQLDEYFFFFSRLGTTFENTVRESSPQNGSTRGLNLVLIVIVLLAIFILAIVVVFGISCFRRHQGHKNQGKFLASFAYLLTFFFFFQHMISRWNIEARSACHFLVWYSTHLASSQD